MAEQPREVQGVPGSEPPPQRCEACGEMAPWWDHIVHKSGCPRQIVLIVRKSVAAAGGEEAP